MGGEMKDELEGLSKQLSENHNKLSAALSKNAEIKWLKERIAELEEEVELDKSIIHNQHELIKSGELRGEEKAKQRIAELEAENEELKCCADLVRFLSETWASLEKLRYNAIAVPDSEIKDFLIMQWPVVQGTQNQINLSAIGKQPYQVGNLAKAVDWMLAQEAK
jgi:DNA repair exonuclease SbcCD ATPase subunit